MDNVDIIIKDYIYDVKKILGSDFLRALVYGSYARGEYNTESDIDIVIFTHKQREEISYLAEMISEITFEYNVKYDVILSPVFQNQEQFDRMIKVVPFYQNISKEGRFVG